MTVQEEESVMIKQSLLYFWGVVTWPHRTWLEWELCSCEGEIANLEKILDSPLPSEGSFQRVMDLRKKAIAHRNSLAFRLGLPLIN